MVLLQLQFFYPQGFQPVTVTGPLSQTEATDCMITSCKVDFATCGQSRYCSPQTLSFVQTGALRDFRFRLQAQVPGARCNFTLDQTLFPLNVIFRGICGCTPMKQTSGNGLLTRTRNGPADSSCVHFHGLGNVFVLCVHVA